jgi:UDP-N-acetylglucosamine 1-carboxyvinyltransferase
MRCTQWVYEKGEPPCPVTADIRPLTQEHAALAASGTSVIGHPEHIDRGYAAFTEILSSLGAQIRREERSRNPSAKKTSSKKQNHLAIGTKRWYDTVI